MIIFHLRVENELGEIPRDKLRHTRGSILETTVSAAESEDLVCVFSVHLALGKHREGRAIALASKLLDFSVSAGFLPTKLVAWEGKYFETLVPILLVQFNQLTVVICG